MKRYRPLSFVALLVMAAVGGAGAARLNAPPPNFPYMPVDLTQLIRPGMPIWPGDPEFNLTTWATYNHHGYYLNQITLGEHTGTHFAAPAHFYQGAADAAFFNANDLVVAAYVIDASEAVGENPDYRLSLAEVQAWEHTHGLIPAGSVVLLRTGWDRYWGNPASYLGLDGAGGLRFPGYSAEAAVYLVEARRVAGLGIDTHGIDPGGDAEYATNRLVLRAGGFHLENLTNLGNLPPTGAVLVIGALPIQGGSGSPARVIALVPTSR